MLSKKKNNQQTKKNLDLKVCFETYLVCGPSTFSNLLMRMYR